MNPFAKQAALAERLDPGVFRSIRWVEACGSTNTVLVDEARAPVTEPVSVDQLDETRPLGSALLVADRQTAGRGRLGRVWESPVGTSLTMSMRLPLPGVGHSLAGVVPLAAGLAALRTVLAVGADPSRVELKWPNDLMDPGTGRKIAGILCESVSGAPTGAPTSFPGSLGVSFVVIGVGINLRRPPHLDNDSSVLATSDVVSTEAIATRAQWVDQIGGTEPDPVEVAALLAHHTAALMQQLSDDAAAVIGQIRNGCATIGRHVRIEQHRESFTGEAVAIGDDGALVVRRDDNNRDQAVHAGDVIHLRSAS